MYLSICLYTYICVYLHIYVSIYGSFEIKCMIWVELLV